MSAAPALELQSVSKRYGAHCAVDDVSLSLPEGVCLALLGHNGAGKTTLMKLMLGLTRPSAGTVGIFGLDPLRAPSPSVAASDSCRKTSPSTTK